MFCTVAAPPPHVGQLMSSAAGWLRCSVWWGWSSDEKKIQALIETVLQKVWLQCYYAVFCFSFHGCCDGVCVTGSWNTMEQSCNIACCFHWMLLWYFKGQEIINPFVLDMWFEDRHGGYRGSCITNSVSLSCTFSLSQNSQKTEIHSLLTILGQAASFTPPFG